jgi:hypothetical protein
LLKVLNVSQKDKTTLISGVLRLKEGRAPQAVEGQEFKGFKRFKKFERFKGFKISVY